MDSEDVNLAGSEASESKSREGPDQTSPKPAFRSSVLRTPPPLSFGRNNLASRTSLSTPASPITGAHVDGGSTDWRAVGSRSRPSADYTSIRDHVTHRPATYNSQQDSPILQLPLALNEAIGIEDPKELGEIFQRFSLSAPPPLPHPHHSQQAGPFRSVYQRTVPNSTSNLALHSPRAYSFATPSFDPRYFGATHNYHDRSFDSSVYSPFHEGFAAQNQAPYSQDYFPDLDYRVSFSPASFSNRTPPNPRRHSTFGGHYLGEQYDLGSDNIPEEVDPIRYNEAIASASGYFKSNRPSSARHPARSPSQPDFLGTNPHSPPQSLPITDASFQLSAYRGHLFTVEFKAGRTELFYILEIDGKPTLDVKIGDFVIVEADRGEDLGKVTRQVPLERLKKLLTCEENSLHPHRDIEPELLSVLASSKEIIPKRIYRLATLQDLRVLQAKAQEEAIAMVRCQSRIRQKRLPMELIDAEYQWDRNKLTFYFIADRRIDFRDLVKDLFRVYKTRIWMCAVDRSRASNPVLKDGIYEGRDLNELVKQEDDDLQEDVIKEYS
jgi:cell fate regulator YaaT (PSP1 superfamily)